MRRRTRGKTRPGRLDAVNGYLLANHRAALQLGDAVDVGCGVGAVTTYEWLAAIESVGLSVPVWAIDSDPSRLPVAGRLHVGTEIPERTLVGVVRAMNVLRQYPVDQYLETLRTWNQAVAKGGVLVEGTSDKTGAIVTFVTVQDGTYRLVVATDFSRGFGPWMFRDYLPNLWRRNFDQHPDLWQVFSRWAVIHGGTGRDAPLSRRFVDSVGALQDEHPGVSCELIGRFAYARMALPALLDIDIGEFVHPEIF